MKGIQWCKVFGIVLGFHIDYYDRSAVVRRFISQLAQNSSNRRESRSSSKSSSHKSSSTSRSSSRSRSQSSHPEPVEQTKDIAIENVKTETHSRSPTPSIANPIKQRRSTDGSQTPSLSDTSPVAGRTFHGPLGSYLSATHTADITSVNSLMVLCEQLNSSATQNNTALSTVYPVQFILKSHAYDARMHFLAGSSTLASILLGIYLLKSLVVKFYLILFRPTRRSRCSEDGITNHATTSSRTA